MKKLLNSCLSIVMLIIAQISLFPQEQNGVIPSKTVNDSGADIQAFTTNGRKFTGELLSIRKNSLMIFNSSNCNVLTNRRECVDQVRKNKIEKLIIEGNSNVALGIGAGLFAGLISLAITMEEGKFIRIAQPKYSEGVTVGAFLGCIIVGGVIGLLTSTQDEIIDPFSEYNISGLSVYAKYPYDEPRDLKKIK